MTTSITGARPTALAARRQQIASPRQEPDVRVFAIDFARNRLIVPRRDGWSRLISARYGAGSSHDRTAISIVDASHACWFDATSEVEVAASMRLGLRVLYVRGFVPRHRTVTCTGLLRELIERAVTRGYLEPALPDEARLIDVMLDECRRLPRDDGTLTLTFPVDARAVRAAHLCSMSRALVGAPDLERIAGCSVRTLQRLFARETGLGLVAWQRRLRLLRSIEALRAGTSVTEAGLEAGYAGTSAFVTAFRRAFGPTPGLAASS